MGACYNRNLAIKLAKGHFLTCLDDDDFFTKDRIENFVTKWNKKSTSTIGLYSNVKVRDSYENSTFRRYSQRVKIEDLYLKNAVGNQIFTTKNILNSSSLYDVNLRSFQDLDLWINLLKKNDKSHYENIEGFSYVLDKSHPHERISSISLDKHKVSVEYILNKYNITGPNKYRLIIQYLTYELRSVNVLYLLNCVCLSFDLYTYLRVLKYYILDKKSR
jgi:hypothetical protein